MSGVPLALTVSDVDAAIAFYSKLFGSAPAKGRPGHANFAIQEPPLKRVLIENAMAAGQLNYVGVEVDSSEHGTGASNRLKQTGLPVDSNHQVTCCYPLQAPVWVQDSDGVDGKIYTVLEDSADFGVSRTTSPACCS
ncbi:MAG: glyoxalase/bleomycin resistance/extradiol dioxygenase family protein [Cyanobacteria bacterium REEB459]|nr:glyoxalase/bleomycin resistance/extradiol dioxygenase family protein [Cyanobacteria bacterium REEB459]